MSVVTKGVIGGVAALLAIGAIALVVWHRWRQSRKRTSVGPSFLSEAMSQGTQATVTPFNATWPTFTEVAPPHAGSQTDERPLVHRPSSREDSPLPLRRVVAGHIGLSSKELARLRSLVNASRAQPTDGRPSNYLLTATTDRGEPGGEAGAAMSSSEAQRLQLENGFLRHEIQQLREEGSELPPSYANGVAL
ncbi:hypothetical protein EDB86DRAFT_570097 [Lactarius hatsudake]|nr:hypothetical protein EDB86DRAFT_570097 [Lactarius hatsudake]